MAKNQARSKSDTRLDKERKRVKEQREALWVYLLIAIVVGLILYGLYLQTLHHP